MDTTSKNNVLGSLLPEASSTWIASTCRSGSATVIKNPNMKPSIHTTINLLLLAIYSPIRLPMGEIPSSAPKKYAKT